MIAANLIAGCDPSMQADRSDQDEYFPFLPPPDY
jgi:hypothetical protein